MRTDPTDADLEAILRAVPEEGWRDLWAAVDSVESEESHATLEGGNQISSSVREGVEHPVFDMPYYDYSDGVDRTRDCLYALGLIVPFDWPRWDGTTRYRGPTALDDAPVGDAIRMLTATIRADRFMEGTVAITLDEGTLQSALRRIRKWHDANRSDVST